MAQGTRRLKADPDTEHLSVTSQAISGGRVTGDGIGPSALARIDEQIRAQPNLGGVIFLQGINDLGTAALQGLPATADDLIAAYREIADRVHAAGVPIYIGTLTPAGNLLRPTPYGSTPPRRRWPRATRSTSGCARRAARSSTVSSTSTPPSATH
ncbi:MAG: hypothetical protein L0I24_00585 [Pseudonocardia sp.]|nr:hypothetical protein [Pseudonocardia sp.]